MARLTWASGVSGLVTVTLTGIASQSFRIHGFAGAANNTANTTSLPNVTITNVRKDDGTTFTATITAPVGGTGIALTRGIHFLQGPEYELTIAQGQSSTLVYTNGSAAGAPELLVWYLQI